MAGRPTYGVLLSMDNIREHPETPFTRCSFEGAPPPHVFVRGPDDPNPVALEGPGEGGVPRREFRTHDGERETETPQEGSPLEPWRIPSRPAKEGQRLGRIGNRLGHFRKR